MSCRAAFPGLCSREGGGKRKTTSSNFGKRQTSLIPFTPKETWTHDFLVLASSTQSVTPDRGETETLLQAGLGRRKLVCPNKNATHVQFQAFLETEFPRLQAGGGFEVLRACGGGGGRRSLALVPPGPKGYDLPYLRGIVGTAMLFIRPLQASLDTSPLDYEVSINGRWYGIKLNGINFVIGMKFPVTDC